ncbi:MAG TPA: hypothetical protein VGL62_09645, partial [Vicinamibacterales bacterium]
MKRSTWVHTGILAGALLAAGCRQSVAARQDSSGVPGAAPSARRSAAAPQSPPSPAPNQPPSSPAAESDALAARVDAISRAANALPQSANLETAARGFATPEAAFLFVRDQIAYEPYAGVQKGAWGTLATRGGNDLD